MRPGSFVESTCTGYSTAPGGALAAAARGSIAVMPTVAMKPPPANSFRRLVARANMPSFAVFDRRETLRLGFGDGLADACQRSLDRPSLRVPPLCVGVFHLGDSQGENGAP